VERRRSAGLAIALALLAACEAETPVPIPAAAARPSFLLILADDLGPDFPAYGEVLAHTPALDALARAGMRFDSAYAAAPVCSPSRAALLTGLPPHANGQVGFPGEARLRAGVRTLAERLSAQGYATGMIGKLHVAPAADSGDPAQLGFRHFEPTVRAREHDPAALARAVSGFLNASRSQPFFLLVGLHEPHTPYPGSEGRAAVANPVDPGALAPLPTAPDLPELRRFRAAYLDAVGLADRHVAAVLAALLRAGREADTAVFLSSDHGPPLPGGKSTLYARGLRVPLLVRWPGVVARGTHSDALVSLLDLAPTLLEAAGAAVDASLAGESRLALLRGETREGADRVFAENAYLQGGRYFPQRAIRTRDFSYLRNLRPDVEARFNGLAHWATPWLRIYDSDPRARALFARLVRHPEEELYDLAADPEELDNRATDPRFAATLGALRGALRARLEATRDPWLALWDRDPDGSRPDRFEPAQTRDGAFSPRWLDAALERVRRGLAPGLSDGDD